MSSRDVYAGHGTVAPLRRTGPLGHVAEPGDVAVRPGQEHRARGGATGRDVEVRRPYPPFRQGIKVLPIRTRTKLQRGFATFVAFGPSAIGTLNGLPVGPDRVLAAESEIEVEFVVEAGYESVSFLLPPADIQAHLRGQHRENEFSLPRGIELLTPCRSAAQELYGWGRRLIDLAARQPDVFEPPQTQSAAHIELLEILLATLGSATHIEPAPHDLTRQAHSRIVQIAEDYALSHTTERVYVTDLCKASEVSERTLQYAFKEVMGMTPVSYLTRLRLHRVRQALRAATHGTTTVTAEALRWGFWHFGDFSRAYRDCFGELPSDTLQHHPGEP